MEAAARRKDTAERNKEIIREFTRIFKNQHNVDGIDHLFASNFTHHFKQAMAPGLAGFKQVGRMMNKSFPDVVVSEEDLIANEDTVVEKRRYCGGKKIGRGNPPRFRDERTSDKQARSLGRNPHLQNP